MLIIRSISPIDSRIIITHSIHHQSSCLTQCLTTEKTLNGENSLGVLLASTLGSHPQIIFRSIQTNTRLDSQIKIKSSSSTTKLMIDETLLAKLCRLFQVRRPSSFFATGLMDADAFKPVVRTLRLANNSGERIIPFAQASGYGPLTWTISNTQIDRWDTQREHRMGFRLQKLTIGKFPGLD
jgi:hypothetical protein